MCFPKLNEWRSQTPDLEDQQSYIGVLPRCEVMKKTTGKSVEHESNLRYLELSMSKISSPQPPPTLPWKELQTQEVGADVMGWG